MVCNGFVLEFEALLSQFNNLEQFAISLGPWRFSKAMRVADDLYQDLQEEEERKRPKKDKRQAARELKNAEDPEDIVRIIRDNMEGRRPPGAG